MLRLSNIGIGVKLSIMSGLGILFVICLIAGQMMSSSSVKSSGEAADSQSEIGRGIMAAKSSVRGLQMAVKDIRIARNDEQLQAGSKRVDEQLKNLHTQADPLLPRFTVPENRMRVEKIIALSEQYAKLAKDIPPVKTLRFVAEAKQKAVGSGNAAAFAAADVEIDALDEKQLAIANSTLPVAAEIERLIDQTDQAASETRKKAEAEAESMQIFADRLALGLGLLTTLIMIGSAILGAVTIAKPLKALVKPLEDVAGGNFAITVPGTGRKDEVGQIASAVQLMAQKVSSTIGEIKSSGREVTNASAEISTSTSDLSQRTEEQAASLEETSAAMEELSATVKKNAENAQQASQSAVATRDVADRGGQVVAQAVEAMAKIEDSSRKISDIIGVIDEIARQTNLLALNAAVEAARAGEAGRGFAVVASEVRSLAQRSSQAAKDIKDLITNSNGQVKDGVELVSRAGASLTEIVESIKKVAVVVADIANASIEQATGIEQINKALTQMDEVTQQNSALVEENAATAKTLEHQAKAMDEQVAFFQIAVGDDRTSYAPARSESSAPRAPMAVSRGPAARKTPVAAKPAPSQPAQRAAGSAGPARRMQTALATAVNADQDWKEF